MAEETSSDGDGVFAILSFVFVIFFSLVLFPAIKADLETLEHRLWSLEWQGPDTIDLTGNDDA